MTQALKCDSCGEVKNVLPYGSWIHLKPYDINTLPWDGVDFCSFKCLKKWVDEEVSKYGPT